MARKRSQMLIENSSSEISLYGSETIKQKKTKPVEKVSPKNENKKIVHNLLISLNRPITSTELLIFLKQYKITKSILSPIIQELEKEDKITVKLYGKTQVFFRNLEIIDEKRNILAKEKNENLLEELKTLQREKNNLKNKLVKIKNLKNEHLILKENEELKKTIELLKIKVEKQSIVELVDKASYDKLIISEKKIFLEQKKRNRLFKNIKYQLEDGFGKKWSEIYEDIFN